MSGWDVIKVQAFKEQFSGFLQYWFIDSKDTGGDTVLGDNIYYAQQRLLDGVWDALSRDVHDIKILKSRQLGASTIAKPLITFWMGVHDGLQGAMIFDTTSHREEARKDIENSLRLLEARHPEYKFPRIVKSNRDGLMLSNRSFLRFLAAGVKNSRGAGTLGRSSGLSLIWGSEMCSWENDEGIKSLRSSISHSNPNRLYLWESTARGPNAWKDMWEEACADDLNQAAVFIGWWARLDQRLLRGTPQFERYGREPPNEDEQRRIDLVEKLYGFSVDQEQLAWYRYFSDPSQEREAGDAPTKDDGFVQQDQPWVAEEAFILTGSSFFNHEKLTKLQNTTVSRQFQAFRFEPGVDFPRSGIVQARTYREVELRVWEEPQVEQTYIIGVDPAYGHSETNDRSAIEVVKAYADGLDQVAEYISGSIQPDHLAWVIWALVGYYGSRSGQPVNIICELNGPGEEVWRTIQQTKLVVERGYLRNVAEERGLADIFRNARQYIFGRSDSMSSGAVYHWRTTSSLKVGLMESLRGMVHSGDLAVRSAELLKEFTYITRDGDTIEAEGHGKDDRAVAMALCVRMWNDRLRRGLVSTNKTRAAVKARLGMARGDQIALYQKFQLDSLFSTKSAARLAAMRQSRFAGRRY
jgi:hypothetical protein